MSKLPKWAREETKNLSRLITNWVVVINLPTKKSPGWKVSLANSIKHLKKKLARLEILYERLFRGKTLPVSFYENSIIQ